MQVKLRKLFPRQTLEMFYRLRGHILGRRDILEFYWRGKISSLPRRLDIDPGNLCNLRCPLCPTGSGRLAVKQELTPLERFTQLLDQYPSLEAVSLFNWGEPFLNPETISMIRYADARGILVDIHSNFSVKVNDDFFDQLAVSGLNTLTLSIDGATQETYEKFRVRGDFNLVISNIKKLMAALARHKISSMRVTWKFIVNRFNEHEIETARAHASLLGVGFQVGKINLNDYYPNMPQQHSFEEREARWLPSSVQHTRRFYRSDKRDTHYTGGCLQVIGRPVINPQGSVAPCCYVTEPSGFFGNALTQNFENIWNNADFAAARSYFYPTRKKIEPKRKLPCDQCNLFQKNNSLWGALKSYRPF